MTQEEQIATLKEWANERAFIIHERVRGKKGVINFWEGLGPIIPTLTNVEVETFLGDKLKIYGELGIRKARISKDGIIWVV